MVVLHGQQLLHTMYGVPFVSKIRGFYSGQINASIFLAVNSFLSRLIQFLSRFDFSRGEGILVLIFSTIVEP